MIDQFVYGMVRMSHKTQITSHNRSLFMRAIRKGLNVGIRIITKSIPVMQTNLEGMKLAYPTEFVPLLVDGYEPVSTEVFKECIRPGSTIADIGAHVGYYSILAAKLMGPIGHVYSFEPSPFTFELLTRNISSNGVAETVMPFRKAVSNMNGEVPFYFMRSSGWNSLHSHPNSPKMGTTVVESITLDSFLQGKKIDVIKIDVEGAEIRVLEGMKDVLATNRDVYLFVEFNPACLQSAGYSPDLLIEKLREMGFHHVEAIDDRSRRKTSLVKVDWKQELRSDPFWYVNLFCYR